MMTYTTKEPLYWAKKNSNLGFSLIELLISLLVISIMLLSINVIQIYISQTNQKTYYLSVAENQIHQAILYLHHQPTEDELATYLHNWNLQNQQILPLGRGYIKTDGSNYEISIFWGTNKQTDCLNRMSNCLKSTTSIELPKEHVPHS